MVEREVLTTTTKVDDLEIHVSVVTTEAGVYTDIREFVPSLGQYGRGVTFPKALTKTVKDGLQAVTKL